MTFFWDFHLLNLSKALGEFGQKIEMHLHLEAKFTECFRQVQQVKVLKKDHEDLCWTLIDTYKLAVYCQNLFLVIYWSHCRKKLCHFLRVILCPGWNHPYIYILIFSHHLSIFEATPPSPCHAKVNCFHYYFLHFPDLLTSRKKILFRCDSIFVGRNYIKAIY